MEADEFTFPMPRMEPQTPSALQYTGPSAPGTSIGVASFQYRSYQCWNSPARSPVFFPISNMAAMKTFTWTAGLAAGTGCGVAQPVMPTTAAVNKGREWANQRCSMDVL